MNLRWMLLLLKMGNNELMIYLLLLSDWKMMSMIKGERSLLTLGFGKLRIWIQWHSNTVTFLVLNSYLSFETSMENECSNVCCSTVRTSVPHQFHKVNTSPVPNKYDKCQKKPVSSVAVIRACFILLAGCWACACTCSVSLFSIFA